MPTIVDIAERAGVPVEGVLRVVNRETVSEAVAERVREAIEELGAPHQHVVESLNVLSGQAAEARRTALPPAPRAQSAEVDEAVVQAREHLLEALGAAAELGTTIPQGVGTVVYEALRLEVKPFLRHVDQMAGLVEDLRRTFGGLREDIGTERYERLKDVELLVDIIVTSWRSVDRRLGRLERMIERLEANGTPASRRR